MRPPRAGTTRPRPSSRPLARSVSMTSSGVCSPSARVSGSVAIGAARGSEVERMLSSARWPANPRLRTVTRTGTRVPGRASRGASMSEMATSPETRSSPRATTCTGTPSSRYARAVASSGSASVERPSEKTNTPKGRPSPNRLASCSSAEFSRVSSAVGLRPLSLSERARHVACRTRIFGSAACGPRAAGTGPARSGHARIGRGCGVLPDSCCGIHRAGRRRRGCGPVCLVSCTRVGLSRISNQRADCRGPQGEQCLAARVRSPGEPERQQQQPHQAKREQDEKRLL